MGKEGVQDCPLVTQCWGVASGGSRAGSPWQRPSPPAGGGGGLERGQRKGLAVGGTPPARACAFTHTHISAGDLVPVTLCPGSACPGGSRPGWRCPGGISPGQGQSPAPGGGPQSGSTLSGEASTSHQHQGMPELCQQKRAACSPPNPAIPGTYRVGMWGWPPRLAAPWRRHTCRGGKARPPTCRPPPPPCTPPHLGV